MSDENIHIFFSTGPYDFHDDELENIDVIDGLESLNFEDDWEQIEQILNRYAMNHFNKQGERK